ncbi:MAG: pilus assembly protein PilX [Gammaproteobacteria bacterium]|jgi:type IV pilus assembly protein PilX|nr:pilus assembly protein PilX [Gammaproteobacteria bacterium]MDB6107652.1 pilus assembly protein PilX [Gammaproteobacteria bacterium]
MSTAALRRRFCQRGMALISSLLLLVVVTILALSMFRSFGIQEKIAGNTREKQRALHAAEGAQQYAEWWLSSSSNAASGPVVCNGVLSANLGQGQICSNKLDSVTAPPLQVGSADAGVTYNPNNAMNATTGSNAYLDAYFAAPRFYIADAGSSADGQGEIYQIDAVGYGANANSVAVVESTFVVKQGVINRGDL